MSAQTDQTATVIRFPQERRRAPTLDALTDAILPEAQLRSLAEIRAVTPPRQVERLRAFGRDRARQIFEATPLPDTREGRQRMASDWLSQLVSRALARVSDARSLTEEAERREIEDPQRDGIYDDLAQALRAEIVAWETAQNILGGWEIVQGLIDDPDSCAVTDSATCQSRPI
ncbi:hypothetical protein [Gluconobacter oxydans]|uniref:hypothetical protein n=1 Tax=Gluconobacter oxydans TaxID=442 RepID=UPI0039EA7A3B